MAWQTDLVKRYPHLFGHPTEPHYASGYPTVEDGWRLIIEKAIERIDDAVREALRDAKAGVRVAQIKEKLGGLRIYIHSTGISPEIEARIREAIDLAEAHADTTCELCGAVGRLYDRSGWYLTRCEQHAQGEPVPAAHGDAGLHIQYAMVDGRMRVVRRRRYDRERDAFVDVPLPPNGNPAEEK